MRIFWAITLCIFLGGCSGVSYVGVPFVQTGPEAGEPAEDYPSISPGSNVRLTLKDGRVVKARFEKFEDQALVISEARLEGDKRDDFNEIHQTETMTTDKQYKIQLADITLLEESTSGGTSDSAGTILVVGTIIGMAFVMANFSISMD